MGITCKPIGKLKSFMVKERNLREKEERLDKIAKRVRESDDKRSSDNK